MGLGSRLADRAARFHAAAIRQADIHDHDVGLRLRRRVDRFLHRSGFADDGDLGAPREQRPQPFADDLVIVADEHPRRVRRRQRVASSCIGSSKRTREP